MTALWICSGVIAILAIWAVTIYNRLVKLRNNRENAFADIDVQLKQRHDLIPQLVATVKGYATHEQETLEKVIAARNGAVNASTINDKIVAENALSSALAGRELHAAAGRDLRCREQTRCSKALLQLGYERTEQRRGDLPVEYLCRDVRVQERNDVRSRRAAPDAGQGS